MRGVCEGNCAILGLSHVVIILSYLSRSYHISSMPHFCLVASTSMLSASYDVSQDLSSALYVRSVAYYPG